MLVAIDSQIAFVLQQIAEASEQIEINKKLLQAEYAKPDYVAGPWAATNYSKKRARIRVFISDIRSHEKSVEELNKVLAGLTVTEGAPSNESGKTNEEVETDLLEFLGIA